MDPFGGDPGDVFERLFSSLRGGNHGLNTPVPMRTPMCHPMYVPVSHTRQILTLADFINNRTNLLQRMTVRVSPMGDPLGNPLGNILRQSMEDMGGTKKIASEDFLHSISNLAGCDTSDEDECPICMDSYCKENTAKKLECGHTFHKDCIVEWFRGDYRCPVCRHEYPHTEISLVNLSEGETEEDNEDMGEDMGVETGEDTDDSEENEVQPGVFSFNTYTRAIEHEIRNVLNNTYQDELNEQRMIQQAILDSIQNETSAQAAQAAHDISGSDNGDA